MRMGRRRGTVITRDELYDEVGAEVTRFFYLMRSNDTPLDFDLELARKQSEDNPGLSVQYAHARASGVFRKALWLGITEEQYPQAETAVLIGDAADTLEEHHGRIAQLLR